jgi:hypothetical protein
MQTMTTTSIELWPIDKLIFYARNPRKNDAAVDRMVASIREFGFKIPVLVRGNGEVVDGHLRLKAARKLKITEVPVILCDEWTEAQVKAFRLMVNRSVAWAEWDEELLSLELLDLKNLDFDLGLTGFEDEELATPASRSRRQVVNNDEYSPSRRSSAPIPPEPLAWSASVSAGRSDEYDGVVVLIHQRVGGVNGKGHVSNHMEQRYWNKTKPLDVERTPFAVCNLRRAYAVVADRRTAQDLAERS